MEIRDVIRSCRFGDRRGAEAVAERSQTTSDPVTADAVWKWYGTGIPEVHWPLVMGMSTLGLTANDLHALNVAARQRRQRSSRGPLARAVA